MVEAPGPFGLCKMPFKRCLDEKAVQASKAISFYHQYDYSVIIMTNLVKNVENCISQMCYYLFGLQLELLLLPFIYRSMFVQMLSME
jgi:hypothetical protein